MASSSTGSAPEPEQADEQKLEDMPSLSVKRRKCVPEEEEFEHKCPHYHRRCAFIAPCCGQEFMCRHCHNEKMQVEEQDPQKRHEIPREDIKEVRCLLCNARQEVATQCCNCGVSFGKWACLKCNMFDDDTSKRQFHCNKCGICRVGGEENFFHCDTCGSCYDNNLSGGRHTCVVNSMKSNCPVCLEYLFDSTRRCSVLSCGHTVHEDCLQELTRAQQITCPLCCKSLNNLSHLWEAMDAEVRTTPMPAEYANWKADILCNDCLKRDRVPFHIVGLRCPSCNGYNTRRIAVERD